MSEGFRLEDHPVVLLQPRIAEPRSWVKHIPFAYLTIDLLRPRRFVELGTHSGNSYLAFCQAVENLGLETECVAVDSWEGDAHAQLYGESIYESLYAYHQPRYSRFSRLLRKYFDDALAEFEDGSIDLLHIDGLHTYDAVKHDFESWSPKLSERAVVLFHDVAVQERGFGVGQFFSEVSQRYRGIRFEHGNGLGVLLVGSDVPEQMVSFVETFEANPEGFRGYFEALGDAIDNDEVAGTELRASVPADCRLYFRAADEEYSEDRQVCRSRERGSGPSLLRFVLPQNARIDYVRIDPSESPGVFELASLTVETGAGVTAEAGSLADRIVSLSGERLPPRTPDGVRWVSINADPNVELRVADLFKDVNGRAVVEATISYDVIVEDAASIRAMEAMAGAFARRMPVSGPAFEQMEELRQRLPLDMAHLGNLLSTIKAAGEATLARANEFAPELARTAANTAEVVEGVAAIHDRMDRIDSDNASITTAIATLQHAANGAAQHGLLLQERVEGVAGRVERLSHELDAVSQALHVITRGIEANLHAVAAGVERLEHRRWWRRR